MLLHQYGSNKVAIVTFDIPKLRMVPVFAKPVEDARPGMDCIVIDSGIQSPSNFPRSEHWTRRQLLTTRLESIWQRLFCLLTGENKMPRLHMCR